MTLHAGELTAIAESLGTWSVWRGRERIGVLEQRGRPGAVWLAGRIHLVDVDEDLVAEGPTALCVLRRLDRRARALASPVLATPSRT